jgi:hypothetical protein
MSARAVLAAIAFGAWLPVAFACGTCAEDKIAATYDHATVQRAAAAGRVMVFCELAGPWDDAPLKRAAARVRGLDVRSFRVAREPAALSFALDPKQQSPQAAVLALQAAAPAGTRVGLVRVGTAPPQ